jgi:hypothetical protein
MPIDIPSPKPFHMPIFKPLKSPFRILWERQFGQSTTVNVTANLIPTIINCYLFDPTSYTTGNATPISGSTQQAGYQVLIVVSLFENINGQATCRNAATYPDSSDQQPVQIWHSVGSGAFALLYTVTTGKDADVGSPAHCGANKLFTLLPAGQHNFYAYFAGNQYLQGCRGKAVKSFACNC